MLIELVVLFSTSSTNGVILFSSVIVMLNEFLSLCSTLNEFFIFSIISCGKVIFSKSKNGLISKAYLKVRYLLTLSQKVCKLKS